MVYVTKRVSEFTLMTGCQYWKSIFWSLYTHSSCKLDPFVTVKNFHHCYEMDYVTKRTNKLTPGTLAISFFH